MVGTVKKLLFKAVCKAIFYMEQTEVLLEVELAPNNRPRSHVEDGV